MGLGGTAQGATTVVALFLGVLVLLSALAILLGVRRLTGRWGLASALAFALVAVASSVPISDHFSAVNREERRTAALRTALVHEMGGRISATFDNTVACPHSSDGREKTRPLSGSAVLPSSDYVADAQRVLRRRGFTTSVGREMRDGRSATWVLGVRGRASVFLETRTEQEVSFWVEDGCDQFEPPGSSRY